MPCDSCKCGNEKMKDPFFDAKAEFFLGIPRREIFRDEDEEQPEHEVSMAVSSMGHGSVQVAVNIPTKLEDRMYALCARDDISRSVVARACFVLGLAILETLPGLAHSIDPGGKSCPSDKAVEQSK